MLQLTAYSIVLLPKESATNKIINLSQGISERYRTQFTLGLKVNIPHLSLYMIRVNSGDVQRLIDDLHLIGQALECINLQALRYRHSFGYYEIEYANTVAISKLQDIIIESFNKYRIGILPNDGLIMAAATGDKLVNFQTYGYAYAGSLFRPHVTLTRFTDMEATQPDHIPDIANFNTNFDRLAVCTLGDNNVCTEVIASVTLSEQ